MFNVLFLEHLRLPEESFFLVIFFFPNTAADRQTDRRSGETQTSHTILRNRKYTASIDPRQQDRAHGSDSGISTQNRIRNLAEEIPRHSPVPPRLFGYRSAKNGYHSYLLFT